MRLTTLALATACAVALATAASARHADGTVTRLLPPPDGQAYFGFTFRLWDTSDPQYGDSRQFDERIRDSVANELAGKTPTFLNVWAPWQRPDLPRKPFASFAEVAGDVAKVNGVTGGALLYLDWNIASTTPSNDGLTTRDIAAGAADHYIRTYARDLREYGRPVLVRLFNGEFNGDWWWGVSPRANHSLTTQDFVAAWRRVVEIFRAVGAANVSWAWVPNAYPATPSLPNIDANIGAYYPGDDYVDWAGADVYDTGSPSWLDEPYAFAVAHGKPFFVAEWAVRHEWSTLTPAQQTAWLEAAFDYFESHPAIKAISYFNYNNRPGGRVAWDAARAVYLYDGKVSYLPNVDDHDHRLLADSGEGWRTLYARRISSARYVSAVASTFATPAPQQATAAITRVDVRGASATVRWRGNRAADAFDLAVARAAGAWRTVLRGTPSTARRFTGARRERVSVRVRPHDVDGVAGAWSPARAFWFGGS